MKSSKVLRDEYGVLVEELAAVVDVAKEEKRELTTEEVTRTDEIETSLLDLDTQIERAEKREKRLDKAATRSEKKEVDKIVTSYNFLGAINARMKGQKLTGLEKEMHEEAVAEAKRSNLNLDGIGVPSMFFKNPNTQRRDLTVGVATDYGNTVATETRGLIDYLWPRTTVETLGATVLSGLTSNVTFPKKSTIPAATWEGEVDDNAESSPTTDTITLTPKRVGTYVDISKQLLIQSSVPGLDTMVRGDIETAIALALETAALMGSGAGNQPLGILNDPLIGVEAIGANGGALTWQHLVALEAAVANDNADFGKMAYLTTPGVRGALKTTEKTASTGAFIWENQAMAGINATIGEGQLNGYRAAISTLAPSNLAKGSGTDLHSVIFGNFQQLMMGQFGGLDIVVDPYTQARKTLVRVVLNSWWDIALRHPEAFAAVKDADVGIFST